MTGHFFQNISRGKHRVLGCVCSSGSSLDSWFKGSILKSWMGCLFWLVLPQVFLVYMDDGISIWGEQISLNEDTSLETCPGDMSLNWFLKEGQSKERQHTTMKKLYEKFRCTRRNLFKAIGVIAFFQGCTANCVAKLSHKTVYILGFSNRSLLSKNLAIPAPQAGTHLKPKVAQAWNGSLGEAKIL